MEYQYAFLGGIGMKELLVIFGIFILLFGAKKIPQLARGLGESIKEFRSVSKEVEDLDKEADDEEA